MSAVQNRRPALELVPQPDTAGDDTEWSINDPAVTTDPAIEQPEHGRPNRSWTSGRPSTSSSER